MPTTAQMLVEYPEILLNVLGEMRGAYLEAAGSREQLIGLLAAQITEPISVQSAYQDVLDLAPQAEQALERLLREHGEMAESHFSREFGTVRQMGPAKLERETPWEFPESVAEILYYNGLIGRGFKGVGQQAHTIVYIPSDVAPWLPNPQATAPNALKLKPVAPPSASRQLPADDSFLEDAGTLLGFVYHEKLRLTAAGPHPEDIDRLVQRLQLPFGPETADLNTRLALLLHLANRLSWFKREGDTIVLTQNPVSAFLEKSRPEQRLVLWDAWRNSPEWNDLCRTPELECTDTGTWKNDPLQSRAAVLQLVGKLQPGQWFSRRDFLHAVHEAEPDFQRPTGDYESWYIRNSTTHEFLKGFETWDGVEGALLCFLLRGPLYWLSALDLAETATGADQLVSLSKWGAGWLGHDVPAPADGVSNQITVGEDFTLTLVHNVPLADRFRVERFAQWQKSYPHYVYQINQRTLKRAAEKGITGARIATFLRERCRNAPARVLAAVEKYEKVA